MLSIYQLLINPLVSFKHLLLVDIVLSIYPLLITALVSFKHLLLVAIVLLIYPAYQSFGIFQTFITSGHCVVELPTANYPLIFLIVAIVLSIYPLLITALASSNIYY